VSANRELLRVLDANVNRAKEALRVAEDLARFVLNDRKLAGQLKKSRHDLTKTVLSLPVPYAKMLQARDSAKDVGKKSSIRDKKRGSGWKDLMISNMKRAQEALRVLEECGKIAAPRSAAKFQKIRFECYELERRSVPKF
jgi:thiamine-phosphate pyrophosphorylase